MKQKFLIKFTKKKFRFILSSDLKIKFKKIKNRLTGFSAS